MRLRVLWLAVMLGAVLALPSVSRAQAPTRDSVTGSAQSDLVIRVIADFTFDVQSLPSGADPTGTVAMRLTLLDLGALEVDCLSVSGNRASMVVRIPPLPAAPAGVLISVEDNDGAGEDRLDWNFVSALPAECPAPTAVFGTIRLGDITVRDAPNVPASKQQCKHGDWRNFPDFKNEGQCVSFVATGGKKQP